MLNQLERHAQRLAFLRVPALIFALIGFIYFVFTLEIPGILLVFWSLLLFTFLNLFQTVPPVIPASEGFFKHLQSRLKRFIYSLLAVLLIGLSLAFVGMTARGLFIYFSQ